MATRINFSNPTPLLVFCFRYNGLTVAKSLIRPEVYHLRRKPIRCDGDFYLADTTSFGVQVYRVDLVDKPWEMAPTAFIKFSECKYAIPRSSRIKLATPQHYREYKEHPEGVRDDLDSAFKEKMDGRTFFERFGTQTIRGTENARVSLTFGRDNFWMFCASVKPKSSWESQRLWQLFPEYNCATAIADASGFAKQLGKDLGKFVSMNLNLVTRSALQCIFRSIENTSTQWIKISVFHGPVIYAENPAEIIRSYPKKYQAAVGPFIKRRHFAKQQEYRFILSNVGGNPNKQILFLPVSDQLRGFCSFL